MNLRKWIPTLLFAGAAIYAGLTTEAAAQQAVVALDAALSSATATGVE